MADENIFGPGIREEPNWGSRGTGDRWEAQCRGSANERDGKKHLMQFAWQSGGPFLCRLASGEVHTCVFITAHTLLGPYCCLNNKARSLLSGVHCG